MVMRGSVCALLAVTMLLAGCQAPVEPPVQTTEGTVPVGTVPVEVDGMFTDRDGRTDYTGGVLVLLEGAGSFAMTRLWRSPGPP